MTERIMEKLEREAYHSAYADGIIDLLVGVSLIWIGVAWLWFPDFAFFAGVVPAVMVTSVLAGRKRFVERRAGYVRWSQPRRKWERRNLVLVFLGGVVMFALGITAFVAFDDGGNLFDSVGPAILAWLLALLAFGLSFLMDARRMAAYGAALLIGGAVAAAVETNPGWPLLAGGGFVAAVGAVMLRRYLHANPPAVDD